MTKKYLTLILRVVVSGALLAYLVIKIEDSSHTKSGNRGVLPPWNAQTASWLGIALVLTFVSVIISALRWRSVLRVLEVERIPSIHQLTSLCLAGMFVGNALPSTVGGDVLRVTRLRHLTGEGPSSFASVVLERLTGWLVLPVLILVGFTINRGFLHIRRAAHPALAIAVVSLILLVIVLVLLSNRKIGGRLGHSEGWRRFASSVHLGAVQFRSRPLSIVNVVGWGAIYQLTLVLAAFCAARALGIDAVGFTAILTFYPAVLIVQVLPISIAGLGLREGLFVLFLQPLGVPDGKSVALGILIYLLSLVVSLAGAPAFAFGRRHGDDDPVTGADESMKATT